MMALAALLVSCGGSDDPPEDRCDHGVCFCDDDGDCARNRYCDEGVCLLIDESRPGRDAALAPGVDAGR